MTRSFVWLARSATVTLGLAVLACSDNSSTNPVANNLYTETKLVSDIADLGGAIQDADLLNPWGLAFSPTGILWVSNNHSGTSTLYDSTGAKKALTVAVQTTSAASGGAPTGVIFNSTNEFVIPGSGAARFIFAGEDGTISAWNTGTNAVIVGDQTSANAVYKGIAMATNNGADFLYLTDFHNNKVDVFDHTYALVTSFTDPGVPSGFAPFGIQTIGGQLWVTFAKQKAPDNEDDDPGVGNGYVDIFNADGSLAKRFASTGKLNSPWAVVVAPTGFGGLSGDVLIGNFGDGLIGAYDPNSGSFIDEVRDSNGHPIDIGGLWGLTFSPTAATTLWFSSGPNEEANGLIGTLKANQP